MATKLQKPADPCMRGTFAGLQKEKEAHSWSKMMMMSVQDLGRKKREKTHRGQK